MDLNWKYLHQSIWGAEVWLHENNSMPDLLHNCTQDSYPELPHTAPPPLPSSDIYWWHYFFIHLSLSLPPSHWRHEGLQSNTETFITAQLPTGSKQPYRMYRGLVSSSEKEAHETQPLWPRNVFIWDACQKRPSNSGRCEITVESHVRLFYDPMDCSTPGSCVLQDLPEFVQIHVHWVGDVI